MTRLNESRIGAVIEEPFAARVSRSLASTLHTQHGTAILVGLDAPLTVTSPGRAPVHGRAVVVPPHLPHAATSSGPALKLLYDPDLGPAIASFSRSRAGAFTLEGTLARFFDEATTAHRASITRPDVLRGLARESGDRLARDATVASQDPRVARVLEALRDPLGDPGEAVDRVGLSESHLQALFARDVGMPMRTYRLWRRLLVALTTFARSDATFAAHAAGFADLAHFSRTCRRMLGNSPRELGRSLLS